MRGAKVCGGPYRAWSALAGAETGVRGSGWALAMVSTRYSTLPVPTRYTTLPVPTSPHPTDRLTAAPRYGPRTLGTCTYDRFELCQGDPRGCITHSALAVYGYQLPHVTIPPRTGTASTLLIVPAAGPRSGTLVASASGSVSLVASASGSVSLVASASGLIPY